MTFLDEAAPWGSPAVPGIPVPPFADIAARDRYVRMLQLHLALLDGGDPSLPTIALSAALEPPRVGRDGIDDRWLTPLELSVSLTSWFPAPWTPEVLAATLSRALPSAPIRQGRGWRWLDDPDFAAAPRHDAGWTVTRRERGTADVAELSSDRDLVVLWMAMFRAKFSYPLGYRRDVADIAALAPATLAVLDAEAKDAAFAYRSSWRTDRDDALGRLS